MQSCSRLNDRLVWGDQIYMNEEAWALPVVWGDRLVWGDLDDGTAGMVGVQ